MFNLIRSYVCHLCSRNVRTGLPELMVNFVTSSYKPELLKPLVERITAIPEVVCIGTVKYITYDIIN